ncbi:hypothetical protein Slin14017_G035760 [Septoria linicola]|nr:hypothetical protein Slin14017_G035760 [Septoria linicola]
MEIAGTIIGFIEICSHCYGSVTALYSLHREHSTINVPQHDVRNSLARSGAVLGATSASWILGTYNHRLASRLQQFCDQRPDGSGTGHISCIPGIVRAEALSENVGTVFTISSLERISDSLPEALRDPAPSTFFAACIIYSLAVTFYHQDHKDDDRFQDIVLCVGIVVVVGVSAGFQVPLQQLVLSQLPWAINILLILSSLGHRAGRYACSRCASRTKKAGNDDEELCFPESQDSGDPSYGEKSWK